MDVNFVANCVEIEGNPERASCNMNGLTLLSLLGPLTQDRFGYSLLFLVAVLLLLLILRLLPS